MIADKSGTAIRRLAYRAFGEEVVNTGTGDAPPYTYTGKELDASGLMYYGARYYDPALARFITPDTVYDAGTQGLNRYAYALNNPVRYNDPTGHASNPFAAMFSGWKYLPEPIARVMGNRMQAEARGAAQGAIVGATTGGLMITSMSVPGTGELLDLGVLANQNATGWQKFGAGVSLGISVLTAGFSPNYGAIDDGIKQLDNALSQEVNRLDALRAKYGRFSFRELNQRINLRGAVKQRYLETVSEQGKGPVLSGVMDKVTGKIYFGQNKGIPSQLHPTLQTRLGEYPIDWEAIYPKGIPGSHSEFRALNDAWLSRPDAEIGDFMIYNVWLRGSRTGLPIPRCPHCESLTNGTQYIPEVLRYRR